MKRKILLFISTILYLHVFCQEEGKDIKVEKYVFKFDFFAPALEYEHSIGEFQTINVHSGIYPSIIFSKMGIFFIVESLIDIQYRRYYNLNKRHSRKKILRVTPETGLD